MQKLNWLYPNFLRRIDHYLKINYPHVWRTRVHDFAWFSLILGNVVAATLGMLMAGYDNVLSKTNVTTMHFSLAVLLGFVCLFWAMRLSRFKIKLSNFRMLLTTWLIYVFCVVSLAINLAAFTFSAASRTANLYPDKVLKSHNDFLNQANKFYHSIGRLDSGECQSMAYDKDDFYLKIYYTKALTNIVSLHSPDYDNNKGSVCKADIQAAKAEIWRVREAKTFIRQPVLGQDYPSARSTFYHELFNNHWIAVLVHTILGFLLMIILFLGKNKLRYWNHIAGILMLIFGVVSLSGFVVIFVEHGTFRTVPKNYLLDFITILPISLAVCFMAAWLTAKQNDQPVLN